MSLIMRLGRNARKFLMDASANYIFFIPVFIFLNTITFFFGLPYWDTDTIVMYVLTGIFGSFFLGGVYGRFLDFWRRRLRYR